MVWFIEPGLYDDSIRGENPRTKSPLWSAIRNTLHSIATTSFHIAKATLHIRASARDMTKPTDLYVPIEIESESYATYEIATRWHIEEWLALEGRGALQFMANRQRLNVRIR